MVIRLWGEGSMHFQIRSIAIWEAEGIKGPIDFKGNLSKVSSTGGISGQSSLEGDPQT